MEKLEEIFQGYTRNGFPKLPPEIMGTKQSVVDEKALELLTVPKHWKQIVKNLDALSKMTRSFQEAIWEIFTTERVYILNLKMGLDCYIGCLIDVQQHGLLIDIDIAKLLLNLKELYQIHLNEWKSTLLPIINDVQATGECLDAKQVLEIYDGLSERLQKPYLKYLSGASHAMHYARGKEETNLLFKEFLKLCEKQRSSLGVMFGSLESILCSPHQRITRYGLLLTPIIKYCDDEKSKMQLEKAHKSADALCRWLNNRVKLSELNKQYAGNNFDMFLKTPSAPTVKNEMERYAGIETGFDVFSEIPGSQVKGQKRMVVDEREDVSLLLPKKEKVLTKILTDCLLVFTAQQSSVQSSKVKKLFLSFPPLKIDTLFPIVFDQVKITLISVGPYGFPEHSLTIAFTSEDKCVSFMAKLGEARDQYKKIKQGKPLSDELMRKLDEVVLSSNYIDSDPETPDECIASLKDHISKKAIVPVEIDLNFDASELGLSPTVAVPAENTKATFVTVGKKKTKRRSMANFFKGRNSSSKEN